MISKQKTVGKSASKKIIVIGTIARGGIKSVIDSYQESGFYSPGRMLFLPSHREGGIFIRIYALMIAFAKLLLLLVLQRVDLVHLHMATKGSFWRKSLFVLLCVPFRRRIIIHLHGGAFANIYRTYPSWKKAFVNFIFDLADAIVVLSKHWEEFIRPLTKAQIKIINNFVHDNFEPSQALAEGRNLKCLYLGQFSANKGIYDLLPVFSEVVRLFPQARLVCGGDGEMSKVRETINSLGASSYIETPGWVSGEDKTKLLHQCGIFILPSYHEGLPMSIIEAMSCSMAVISTRVGGVPALVDDANGILVSPGEKNELFGALCKLLSYDPETLYLMGKASRQKYCQLFSAEYCHREMRALYHSLGVEP